MLWLFRWLWYVSEFVYAYIICSFYLLHTKLLCVPCAIGYFALFYLDCPLLIVFTSSMPRWCVMWGKFYFCLSHVNSQLYQYAAYLPWHDPYLTSNRACAALCDNVCRYNVGCAAFWWVNAFNMPVSGFLTLLNGGNIIPLLTHCCLPMTHMCPWICCLWSRYFVVFHWHHMHKNVL